MDFGGWNSLLSKKIEQETSVLKGVTTTLGKCHHKKSELVCLNNAKSCHAEQLRSENCKVLSIANSTIPS